MKEVAQLLNVMRGEGVITGYALFGAVAQMRYTEPVATLDADVLVVVPSAGRLDVLTPIYEFCARKGYNLRTPLKLPATPDTLCVGAVTGQKIFNNYD